MAIAEDLAGSPSVDPIILHYVRGKYLIYDTAVLKYLRETHQMCGVLIGTLPQISQQNVFLGLPLQLMVEEAAFLVKHGYGYVVEDRTVHQQTVATISNQELESFKETRLAEQARKYAAVRQLQADKKRAALEKRGLVHLLEAVKLDNPVESQPSKTPGNVQDGASTRVDTVSQAIIYKPPTATEISDTLIAPHPSAASYNLFEHLHDKGYFLTPGLRFGAQFVAYPGDPLRFHSHFVSSGHDWDEKIPVMDIVAGGRLGTGVKKAWMIGGKNPESDRFACFTVEWAGM